MNFGWFDSSIRFWLGLGGPTQLAMLVIAGLIAGAIANYIIVTWCWYARPASPWTQFSKWPLHDDDRKAAAKYPPRTWLDRIPIVGWWRMRREAELLGEGFWIRPLLIELSLALIFPWMHWAWTHGQMLPAAAPDATVAACAPWMTLLFFVHAFLLMLMVASTFIDFDERTIPDGITIPGTMIALVIATMTPYVFLPGAMPTGISPVTLQHPLPLSAAWMGKGGLVAALLIWTTWCFALADRRLILRRGWEKALGYFLAGLTKSPFWKYLLAIWAVGLIAIVAVYSQVTPQNWVHWLGLMTSLLGLAVGGGIVWSIRIVGTMALRKEAMGFGDVTLMAMIGAFVGWQASMAAFFLAPLAAIVIVLIVWMITRDPATPFGPYLCAGTVLTLLNWDTVYNENLRVNILLLGDFLLYLSIVVLALLYLMLWVLRMWKDRRAS